MSLLADWPCKHVTNINAVPTCDALHREEAHAPDVVRPVGGGLAAFKHAAHAGRAEAPLHALPA